MTGTVSPTLRTMSPPQVADAAKHGGGFSGVADAVRGLLAGKQAEAVADYFGVSLRTAQRILAGHLPNTPTMLRMMFDDEFGPPIVEAILETVPEERRAALARSLKDAIELVEMKTDHERLARELAKRRAGR